MVILGFATINPLRSHASVEYRYTSILPASIGSFCLVSHRQWLAGDCYAVTELLGAAAPVKTPLIGPAQLP
jgi:hypothetical protein